MSIQNTSLSVTGASTVNFGSGSALNNTPVFNTYRSQVNIGDGGQGSVNVETAVNLGGFASLNLVNADINMADDSIINQTGTRTIPNNMYSMNMIAGSQITFPDTTTQNSAYTGAAALAGTYGPVQMTVDANGKITALSNAVIPPSTDISVNTITQPIVYNPSAPVGYTLLQTGSNACCSISNGLVYPTGFSSAMVSDYVANKGVLISLSPSVNLLQIPSIKLRITFSFFGPPSLFAPYQNYLNWGQTTCDMDMYPACWTQANFNVGTGTPVGLGANYNINNKIGGISSFSTVPFVIGTIAPNGRQYWTYNQSFSGTSGPNGYLCPISSHQWLLLFSIPSSGGNYSWSGKVEMLDATAVIGLGGTVGLSTYAIAI
jgi:hypothetical protein